MFFSFKFVCCFCWVNCFCSLSKVLWVFLFKRVLLNVCLLLNGLFVNWWLKCFVVFESVSFFLFSCLLSWVILVFKWDNIVFVCCRWDLYLFMFCLVCFWVVFVLFLVLVILFLGNMVECEFCSVFRLLFSCISFLYIFLSWFLVFLILWLIISKVLFIFCNLFLSLVCSWWLCL